MQAVGRAAGEVAAALVRAVADFVARRSLAPRQQQWLNDVENPDTWVGLDYVHDRVLAQLQEQWQVWQEADGRLRMVLGIIGIVFAVTLGLLPRGSVTIQTQAGTTTTVPILLPFWVGALAITGLMLFAVAGGIAVIAYWPRDFSWPPAPESLRKYVTTNPREIKLTVLDEMLDAYAANGAWLGRKILAFRWAVVIAGIATAVLGASVIIQLAQLTRVGS